MSSDHIFGCLDLNNKKTLLKFETQFFEYSDRYDVLQCHNSTEWCQSEMFLVMAQHFLSRFGAYALAPCLDRVAVAKIYLLFLRQESTHAKQAA